MLFKVPVAPQDQLGMLSLHVEGLIKSFIPPEVTSTGAEQLGGGLCAPAPGRLCAPWDLAMIHAFIQDLIFLHVIYFPGRFGQFSPLMPLANEPAAFHKMVFMH